MCGSDNAKIEIKKDDVKKGEWAEGCRVGGFVCDDCTK